ncbi:MAG: hypothetical protein Q7S18_01580 [bacterium]|nr:hypothetical protein [bacterium]
MKVAFRFQGVHHCEAVVLTCIDFRFWRETLKFVEEELKIKDFDFPSLPGSAKAINECASAVDLAMNCIGVPVNFHHAEKIVIVNHQDCGAYGGSAKFGGDGEAEQKFHEGELQKAKEKVLSVYPDKEVILVYAKLIDDGNSIDFLTF